MENITPRDAAEIFRGWGFSDDVYERYLAFRHALKERGFITDAELRSYLRELQNHNIGEGQPDLKWVKQLLTLSGDAYEVRTAGQTGLAWTSTRYIKVSDREWLHLAPDRRAPLERLPVTREGELDVIAYIAKSARYTATPPPNTVCSKDPLDLLPELPWVTRWAKTGVDVHPKTAGSAALWRSLCDRALEPKQLDQITFWSTQVSRDAPLNMNQRTRTPREGEVSLGFVEDEYSRKKFYALSQENNRARAHELSSGEAHMALISRGVELDQPEVILCDAAGYYKQTSPLPNQLRATLALIWGPPVGWLWRPPESRATTGERLLRALGLHISLSARSLQPKDK